ncbi:MAG: hypothetical protein K9M36_02870 [Candidatus Pacebacteria bacterium]|nr:hypothetical protein [Candidatus Paceibacterota bacterium]
MKEKIISGLLILLFCLGILLMYTQIKKNKQEDAVILVDTQNHIWETYQNDAFAFKYPGGFFIDENEYSVSLKLDNINETRSYVFTIFRDGESFNGSSVLDWWNKNGPQNERQAPYPDIEKNILINERDAYLTIYESSRISFGYSFLAPISIYIFANNQIFEITTHKIAQDVIDSFENGEDVYEKYGITHEIIKQVEENQKIFWEIIETLEFFKPKQEIEIVELEKDLNQEISIAKIELNPVWYKEMRYEYPETEVPGKEVLMNFLEKEIDAFWCVNDDDQKTQEEIYENDLISSYTCNLSYNYAYKIYKDYFSHILTGYTFAGGAHGISNFYAFVFDQQGKQYSLYDFLTVEYKEKNEQEILNEIFSYASHVDEYFSIDDLNDITEIPFYFSEGNIHFVFSENHGISHVAGFVGFRVPLEKIQHILRIE